MRTVLFLCLLLIIVQATSSFEPVEKTHLRRNLSAAAKAPDLYFQVMSKVDKFFDWIKSLPFGEWFNKFLDFFTTPVDQEPRSIPSFDSVSEILDWEPSTPSPTTDISEIHYISEIDSQESPLIIANSRSIDDESKSVISEISEESPLIVADISEMDSQASTLIIANSRSIDDESKSVISEISEESPLIVADISEIDSEIDSQASTLIIANSRSIDDESKSVISEITEASVVEETAAPTPAPIESVEESESSSESNVAYYPERDMTKPDTTLEDSMSFLMDKKQSMADVTGKDIADSLQLDESQVADVASFQPETLSREYQLTAAVTKKQEKVVTNTHNKNIENNFVHSFATVLKNASPALAYYN